MKTFVYKGPSPAKVHTTKKCRGLEHATLQRVETVNWHSWLDVLECRDVRPCRKCALDIALLQAFANIHNYQGNLTGLCIASQGNPSETSFTGESRHTDTSFTQSGKDRLETLAQRENLPLYDTCVGPVAWLVAPTGFAYMMERNLRVLTKDTTPPTETQMQLAWKMMSREGWQALNEIDIWKLVEATVH